MKTNKLIRAYFYEFLNPLLITFFFIFFLYAQNVSQLPYNLTIRVTLISLFITIVIYSLLSYLFKNKIKSSLSLCILLIALFSFGRISTSLPFFELLKVGGLVIGKNKVIFLIESLVVLFLIRKVSKTEKKLRELSKYIFLITSFLILFNFGRIFYYWITNSYVNQIIANQIIQKSNTSQDKLPKELPDIYYLVLDMHTRSDVLKELYNYQDEVLIPYLSKKGFYIASNSHSNYLHTSLSLASSLNLDYIENLFKDSPNSYKDYLTIKKMIDQNKIALELKKLGYTYITFNSGFSLTETSSIADIFYNYEFGLNRFEQLFLNTTLFSKILRLLKFDLNSFHRERILSIFEKLKNIPKETRPTFTFAHIISPHPPFIFGSNGESRGSEKRFTFKDAAEYPGTKEEYKTGYINQLSFIDKKLIETIEEILLDSEKKPIIILQGDHGPSSEIDWNNRKNLSGVNMLINPKSEISIKERSSILNAYYFPNNGSEELYEDISPVNTFRLLLKYYFDYPTELLEDKIIIDK